MCWCHQDFTSYLLGPSRDHVLPGNIWVGLGATVAEIIERESRVRRRDMNIVAEVGRNCLERCRDINSIAEVRRSRIGEGYKLRSRSPLEYSG
jgi:hypothetical protein